jgi:heptosyltransferase-2
VHAARALGVPTVAFFGPTDPTQHAWEPSTRVVVRGVPCQPCHPHGPAVCPLGHHDCLRTLEVEPLLSAVRERVGG